MGYVDKTTLIEELIICQLFTPAEIDYFKNLITVDKIYDNEAILKLPAINTLEKLGILKRFYDICKRKGYFPDWLRAVETGKDAID